MRHSCAAIWGDVLPVWEASFRTLTLGDPGTLPGSLSFARAGSGFSVQTSENTIMVSAGKNFNGDNFPRVGQPRGTASKGLCLESYSANEAAFNVGYADPFNVSSDLRDYSNATAFNGNASAGTAYTTGTGSPDGISTAKLCTTLSGGFGRGRFLANAMGNSAANNSYPAITFSTWQKSSGTIQQTVFAANAAFTSTTENSTTIVSAGGNWRRLVTTITGIVVATQNIFRGMQPVDGRSGVGGSTGPYVIAAEVDCVQMEGKRFASNWIPPNPDGSGYSRGRERLYHTTRTTQIINGRLCLELTISPMGSSTDYQDEYQVTSGGTFYSVTEQHLWWVDASNRGFFDPITREITTVVNGVSYVHNTVLTWALGDTIQIWIEAGNGTPRASYRVSSNDEVSWGTAIALGTGSAQASLPSGAGTIDFLSRGTASEDVFSCWVKGIRVFDNRRPSWVV